MKQRVKTVLGFLIAPLAPVIVGTAISSPSQSEDPGIFVVMGAIVYVYSCGLMVIFGVPAYLFLNRKNSVKLWSAMLVGLLVGTLMATIFRIPNHPRIEDIFVMAFTGALGGLIFWLIWRRSA